MKKLIFSIAISSASLLNAQNNEMPNQNELNDLIGSILLAKTEVYSYDPNFSIEMGGKGLAHYIIQSDSAELFSLFSKMGFYGANIYEKEKKIINFWAFGNDGNRSNEENYVFYNGIDHKFSSKAPAIKIMKEGLQSEFKLAQGANFKVIKIELEQDGENLFINEVYEYVDINNQKVRLEADFMNGQLRGFDFHR